MENLGKITSGLLLIIFSFLLRLLEAHVIMELGALANINLITAFSFAQVYIILTIMTLISWKASEGNKKTYEETVAKVLMNLVTKGVAILLVWGGGTLIFNLLS